MVISQPQPDVDGLSAVMLLPASTVFACVKKGKRNIRMKKKLERGKYSDRQNNLRRAYRLVFIDGRIGFLRIFYPYSNKILAKRIIK